MERKGLNGTTLKIIAVVSMLIDHTGLVLLRPYLLSLGITNIALQNLGSQTEHAGLVYLYFIMRGVIGRLAFPIFAYLVVEGITHTKNLTKYAMRLLAFGLLSEIPFDLAIRHQMLEFSHQNVMFTLFLGVLALWGYETISRQVNQKGQKASFLPTVLALAMAIVGVVLAELLRTDYAGVGVLVILAMYLTRDDKRVQMVVGGIALLFIEPFALLGLIPIYFYNGERGRGMKYFFYAFYPVHLLLLYCLMKLFCLEA